MATVAAMVRCSCSTEEMILVPLKKIKTIPFFSVLFDLFCFFFSLQSETRRNQFHSSIEKPCLQELKLRACLQELKKISNSLCFNFHMELWRDFCVEG
jgi:hypothetical protein